MNNSDSHSILFIDIENCPSKIDTLLTDLILYSKIVICYAKTGVKIPLEWLIILSPSVVNKKLEIIEMPFIGDNAADFGIAFLLGTHYQSFNEFVIYSNDKGFDVIIKMLDGNDSKKARRISDPPKPNIKTDETYAEMIQNIKDYFSKLDARSRPSKETSLKNSLRSRSNNLNLKDEAKENLINRCINLLKKENVITQENNNISYDENNLQKFISS